MDLFQSLNIPYIFLHIVGITPWIIPRKSYKLHLSPLAVFYSLVVIAISTVLCIYGIVDVNFRGYFALRVGDITTILELFFMRLGQVVYTSESLLERKTEKHFFEQVRSIDDNLKQDLKTNIDYKKFRDSRLLFGLLSLIVYCVCFFINLTINEMVTHQHSLIYELLYFWPKIVCAHRFYHLLTFLAILKSRLELLANITSKIHLHATNSHIVSHTIDHDTEMKRLQAIRKIYNQLWQLNTTINSEFGHSMLAGLTSYFVSITANCFWIYLRLQDKSEFYILNVFVAAISCIPDVYSIIIFSISSEHATKCSADIALALHHVPIDLHKEQHNSLIEQFSLQLLHQKIKISAAGFFDIDCALMYKIISACVTYFILFIQINMAYQQE